MDLVLSVLQEHAEILLANVSLKFGTVYHQVL